MIYRFSFSGLSILTVMASSRNSSGLESDHPALIPTEWDCHYLNPLVEPQAFSDAPIQSPYLESRSIRLHLAPNHKLSTTANQPFDLYLAPILRVRCFSSCMSAHRVLAIIHTNRSVAGLLAGLGRWLRGNLSRATLSEMAGLRRVRDCVPSHLHLKRVI